MKHLWNSFRQQYRSKIIDYFNTFSTGKPYDLKRKMLIKDIQEVETASGSRILPDNIE